MEYAFCDGKKISASEVAEDYYLEKIIRKASAEKKLLCIDSYCQHKILRYCHGERKNAYFAHLSNSNCDYAKFDRNNEILRPIRLKLYNHFVDKGYNVELEAKVLKHHYSHMLFRLSNNIKMALELVTQQTTVSKIETLTEEYFKQGISTRWIVVANNNFPIRENKTFFIKRYLLNESKNKDLLVLDFSGVKIAQFKSDPTKYTYEGKNINFENNSEIFAMYAPIDEIIIQNGELTISGFDEEYNQWLIRKKELFDKKIAEIKIKEQQEKERLIQKRKLFKHNDKFICNEEDFDTKTKFFKRKVYFENREDLECADFENAMAEYYFGETEFGPTQWSKCNRCGEIGKTVLFNKLDHNNANKGICRNCYLKNK